MGDLELGLSLGSNRETSSIGGLLWEKLLTMSLEDFGWGYDLAQPFDCFVETTVPAAGSTLEPARVVSLSREVYRVRCAEAELPARPSGRLRAQADLPAVGDWVVVERASPEAAEARVVHVLPRRSRLSRKVAGDRTDEQVVAANLDTLFLVMGLDGDYNLRRLERFAVMAWESGAQPVVVLNKSDLCADVAERRLDATVAAPGVPVFAVSAVAGLGLEPLDVYLRPGQTVVLVGSSGVGKSTLVNRWCRERVMQTRATRAGDDRGRHTTSHRQLIRLPSGGLLIDNPGIRELQLWAEGDAALGKAFADIGALAASCRFRDCRHLDEPGCTVRAAVEAGRLDSRRLESLRGLEREVRYLELRQDDATRRGIERKQGAFYKSVQKDMKARRRLR